MKLYEMRSALKNGETILGIQCFTSSTAIVEIIGYAGFDFVMIDTEHAAAGVGLELENLIRAAQLSNTVAIVRVYENNPKLILKTLEMGAEGILVPRLKTREDVVKAMKAVKYPPEGVRGFCPYVRSHGFMPKDWNNYLDKADSETMFIPLIEEKEAVDNINEIASVEGIDWIWFGCGDLCMSMGLRGDINHPLVLKAREKVLTACKSHNIPVAEIGWNVKQAKQSIEDGFSVIMYTPDTNVIFKAMRRIVEDVKGLPEREMP